MKKKYLVETNNIIALCHIIDDFEDFEKRLMPLVSQKYNRDFVFQLWDIAEGKFKIGARKAKKFYSENKSVINTINQYSNITRFINNNYGWHVETNGKLLFFYEYISKHKDKIGQILAVLGKLKELGFRRFEFDETLNFTKEVYDAYPTFERNFDITYVANIEVMPSYLSHINYKTTNSNYKMELRIRDEEISEYGKEIKLNSLLFDPNTLPVKVDRENTYDQLLKLKDQQNNQSSIIRNSVDLSISIMDLEQVFNYTNEKIKKLDNVENKEELVQVLTNIKKELENLKNISAKYNSTILQEEPLLTEEILEKEKNLYLERRFNARIDSC